MHVETGRIKTASAQEPVEAALSDV
jgi:hypothetical protein